MPDYIYLLENRLSSDQRHALAQLREAAREAGTILFLTGDAVRDLTSGHAVRELEVAVHGNALKLKKPLEKLDAKVWGEDEASRSLYLCFPGTVRVDLVSTHRVEYPKPGKAVFHPASIQEDLRRRDFTVNSMAISLNEGSFGLLMDPLNGAADIEARTLRLVSNYGFLEEPSLLIRATRYRARLGWEMDPRTQSRYENAKAEGMIDSISAHAHSQELEQIGHEEDGLKVLRALDEEGWMKVLFPAWTAAKADEEKLKALHDLAVDLLLQGVHPDMSAAQMQLLTAKLPPKDVAGLKKQMLRPGFVEEWNSLDAQATAFQKELLAKQNATPSASFKLFTNYDPEAVLWLAFTSKTQAVQERYHQFLKVWPESRQKVPYALMQEMRITPELLGYNDLVQAVFLELIDGKLTTPEEMRAYLEPHSPPAPPPQQTYKKARGRRAEAKVKEQYDEEEESEDDLGDEDSDDLGGDDEELEDEIGLPKGHLDSEAGEEDSEADEDSEEKEPAPVSAKASAKLSGAKGGKAAAGKTPPPGAELKTKAAAGTKSAGKPAAGKLATTQPIAAKPAAATKPAPAARETAAVKKPAPAAKAAKATKPAKPAVKAASKPTGKTAAKVPAKAAAPKTKASPAKSTKAGKAIHGAKPAARKPLAKPAKKR
jgi:tRNA nucleotidyltransferase/poly(A) polymerase